MNNEDKLFNLMTQMYSEMKDGFNKVDKRLTSLESGQKNLENEIKKTTMIIENEIQPNIQALFDGYTQNSEKLDRIEKEVSLQEEIILRKIK